jgi:hypothetical protein
VLHPRTRPAVRHLSTVAAASAALAPFALFGGCAAARPAGATAACGAAGLATIAAVDQIAADHIYGNELAGTEVSFDSAQITAAVDLLAAVAAEDAAAARTAVSRLVFHPAWHIVRLRALDAAGHILADVGGPYVIAPVSGALRLHGHTVGSYVMSVQDDTGYTKLETRFVGNPIGIYIEGKLVAERYAAFPSAPPASANVTLGGVSYRVLSETYKSFPSGTLNAVILVAGAALRRVRADRAHLHRSRRLRAPPCHAARFQRRLRPREAAGRRHGQLRGPQLAGVLVRAASLDAGLRARAAGVAGRGGWLSPAVCGVWVRSRRGQRQPARRPRRR